MKVFIAATLGSLGFGLLFGNRGVKLLFSALGGAVCWGVYLLAGFAGVRGFLQVLLAALAAALYAELMARMLKAPATIFSLIAAMPLVPGGSLYRTMDSILAANSEAALQYGISTITTAAAIAVGIVAVSLVFKYATRLFHLAKQLKK